MIIGQREYLAETLEKCARDYFSLRNFMIQLSLFLAFYDQKDDLCFCFGVKNLILVTDLD